MRHFVDPIQLTRVIDGDTVECKLDRGWKESKVVSLRLAGINTPESKATKTGGQVEKATGMLVGFVVAKWIRERIGTQLYHTSDERPKFHGRTVGRLIAGWPKHDETDDCLNDYLLLNKLGRPYAGGTRSPWTEAELAGITARAREILDNESTKETP